MSEQGDDNYNGGVCMCVALALLSVCVSIMRACVCVCVCVSVCVRERSYRDVLIRAGKRPCRNGGLGASCN